MNYDQPKKFELPPKMEKILASLSNYYAHQRNTVLQKIVVNSKYTVRENFRYDNWNGGTYGHALYLKMPSTIFQEIVVKVDEYASEIRERINIFANVQNENIAIIFLELLEEDVVSDWREASGQLIHSNAAVRPTDDDHASGLWTPNYLKLFLSHKADYKCETAAFKDAMAEYGVSCFVAHQDIEPTKEWQVEIERALRSMEALAALLTTTFSDSNWTDQEVGAAVGRKVPIIPIKLGIDPYGFIGKIQAVQGNGVEAPDLALKVYNLLWKDPGLKFRLSETLIHRFKTANSYAHANKLMAFVEKLEDIPTHMIDELDEAWKTNRQVSDAREVKNRLPPVLNRLRGLA